MCLINLHVQDHPNYKLILIANRDEFYNRPTAPANFWDEAPNLLAGRDLLGMGTWLGVTREGRIAALTNYRDLSTPPVVKNKVSRGKVVTNYLTSTESPELYLKHLHEQDTYEGFNILLGDEEQLFYSNNINMKIEKISPGTHGLSNHLFNTPWPKVNKSKQRLAEYVLTHEVIGANDLFDILTDKEQADDADLPNTGVGIELERELSSAFIQTPDYGTRCSTVLFIDHNNYLTFVERTYRNGEFVRDNRHSFQIQQPVI